MSKPHEMERIVQALESYPNIAVPDDFARRVVGRLQTTGRPRYRLPSTLVRSARLGRATLLLAIVALLVGMVLVAQPSRESAVWFLLQTVLVVQFCSLVLWAVWALRRA